MPSVCDMKIQLLIIVISSLFVPLKMTSSAGRVMEILNMSITGNSCHIYECQMNKSDALFSVCFVQQLDESETEDVLCTPITNYMCSDLSINQFKVNKIIIPTVRLFPQIRLKIFVNIHCNKSDKTFQISDHNLRSEDINFIERSTITTASVVQMINKTVTVQLFYVTRCAPNYYGLKCDNFCKPVDNEVEHYGCTEEGKPVCLPGWEGSFCSEAVCDGCVNGQCLAPNKCKCHHGWRGSMCSVCLKAPGCKHGACDINNGVPFSCVCDPGWGGQNCDIDLKYCLNHLGRCQNNGTCQNYYGDARIHYVCRCAPGYFGRQCHFKSGDCTISNCVTEKCRIEPPMHTCRCYSGFSGKYCQVNDTLQASFPSHPKNMQSDGSCVSTNEGYFCSCSRFKLQMCQCTFIKCPIYSTCIDTKRPNVYCSSSRGHDPVWQLSSNFLFDTHPPRPATPNTIETAHPPYQNMNSTFYIASFFFIPILLAVLIVLAFTFRFQCQKKSKACIKTIHNDLHLPDNFQEQKFLLRRLSLSTSWPSRTFSKNVFVQNNLSSETKEIEKWRDCENTNMLQK